MKITPQYVFMTATMLMTAASLCAAGSDSGGKGDNGLALNLPTVSPGTLLIRESFGNGPGVRPSGTNGAPKPSYAGADLSSFWAEYPGNNTVVWSAPDTHGLGHTWTLSASSIDPKEAPSPLDNPGINGTVTLTGSNPSGLRDNPAAILPFSAPPIAYEASMDVAIQPQVIGDWLGIGFSSSTAVSHNLEKAGQAWMLMRMDRSAGNPFHAIVELHTSGMSGASVRAKVILLSFDTLTVRYDPVAKVVSGYFNGSLMGTIPYNASIIRSVGFEGASAGSDWMTVDNFIVKASN